MLREVARSRTEKTGRIGKRSKRGKNMTLAQHELRYLNFDERNHRTPRLLWKELQE